MTTKPCRPRLPAGPILALYPRPWAQHVRHRLSKIEAAGTITVDLADVLAVEAGCHPASVWPEWCEVPIEERMLEPRKKSA